MRYEYMTCLQEIWAELYNLCNLEGYTFFEKGNFGILYQFFS